MYVLFTVGGDLPVNENGLTEWVAENVFVQIEEYTDEEMRYAWNLAENQKALVGMEVVDFEILSDREYAERLVAAAEIVSRTGCPEDMRYIFPRTLYAEAA